MSVLVPGLIPIVVRRVGASLFAVHELSNGYRAWLCVDEEGVHVLSRDDATFVARDTMRYGDLRSFGETAGTTASGLLGVGCGAAHCCLVLCVRVVVFGIAHCCLVLCVVCLVCEG